MSPRPKNPPPDRRGEILDAALRLFAEKGFSAATNAEIARAAGVTPAALYYYFPSKEELFRAAVSQRLGQFVPTVTQLTEADMDRIPLRELFRMLLQRALAFFGEERTQLALKIVMAEGPRRPEIRQIWAEQAVKVIEPLFPYLRREMAEGQIRRMDPRLFFLLLQGPLMAAVVLRDLLEIPLLQGLRNEELVEALLETTLPGLLTDGR